MNTPPDDEPPAIAFPVVGVGASAGGLEAITRLLRALPAEPGLALILVLHLDPKRESHFADILSRVTALPVTQAEDGSVLEPNRVYVIPPDVRLGVDSGVVRLQPRGDRGAPHHPVDYLFRSLAAAFGPQAVAVVLSGGGTDGTLGLGDVREVGGVAFAQDEASAGQTGMPASAAGHVDAVLTPEGIAAALVRLAGGHRPADRSPVPTAEDLPLEPFYALLRAGTGIDFALYKPSTIRRRVRRRMTVRGFATPDELAAAVRDDPAELAVLTRDLLIGVTRFFRDPDVFEGFQRTTVPVLVRDRAAGAPLRVWVAGCSTGEEAYSVAIVLLEALGDGAEPALKILATDVNNEALARARAGVYPDNIAADVSPDRLRRFFKKVPAGYRIAQAVRDLCVFARHDLAADPPFARMDLVTCRNVLIYFDTALQRRVLPVFHYALRPGGFLLLGPSETVGPFGDLFAAAGRDERVFTRTLAPARTLPGPASTGPAWGRPPEPPAPGLAGRGDGGLADVQREADRVLARYAPAGVVIDEHLNILQFRGDTDPFLRHPPGTAGLDLMRMAREGLLADLRDGVAAARAGSAAVRRPGVRVREGDASRTVALHIVPLAGGPALRCFLVLFEDETEMPAAPAAAPGAPGDLAERLVQLRGELEASREHQQAVAEEYEATNEELKAANEEILASNEELQSTNEELQTAKEEMQATNEELETVNEELEHRNRELGRTNDDLQSLLVGVNVPVIVVGRDLLIRQVTVQAEAAFDLRATDIGRGLRERARGFEGVDLGAVVTRVLDTLETVAFDAQDRAGRWYAVRVRPFETGDNRIDGAIITALDIDASRRAEAARRDLEAKMLHAQKLESLGVMAGGIAHDLNNLLTPLIGYAELAQAAVTPASAAAPLLREVDRAARLAVDLVMQILIYSGKARREVRTADLNALVGNLGTLLERAVGARAVLRLELAPEPLPIEADAAQVAQVVLNMVTNAAEAITTGRGTVTVRTGAQCADRAFLASPYHDGEDLPEGRYAVLEVADTGEGMSAETRDRLFDPFYTTKFTGRGLGLAAVRGIVRSHGGTVRVTSFPGRGSTFHVLLPLSDAPPAPVVPAAPAAVPATPETVPWRGSGTILVVDDEPPVRGFVTLALTRVGFAVVEAASGEEAMALLGGPATDIRAVLLDLTMPKMSGTQVAVALRAARPGLPILVMSGYSDGEVAGLLSSRTIDGFLHKPFALGRLVAAVRSVLESPR